MSCIMTTMAREDGSNEASLHQDEGVLESLKRLANTSLDEFFRSILLGDENPRVLAKAEKNVLSLLRNYTNTALLTRNLEEFVPGYSIGALRLHIFKLRKKLPNGLTILPKLDSHCLLYDSQKPIEEKTLSNPRFFTAKGKRFAVTDQGQFICFSVEDVFPEGTKAGKIWKTENATSILLEPSLAALLYFFAENYDVEHTKESVLIGWRLVQDFSTDDITAELDNSQANTLRWAISVLKTVLPPQVQIESKRVYGYRFCEQ
jgi:hypothetical protein